MADQKASVGKVLLVEDDEGIRLGLSDLIEELAPVHATESLAEALTALASERFCFVLSDVRLGRNTDAGRQLVRAARDQLAPIAVMSGLLRDEIDAALGPGNAPDEVITKPFGLEEMFTLVERFVRGAFELAAATEGSGGVTWHRLGPGEAIEASQRGRGLWLAEGSASVGARARAAPGYLFLAPGQRLVAGPEGARAASRDLG